MKVEIMRKVWEENDSGKPSVGNFLLEEWSHDPQTVKLYRSSSNFIYWFKDGEEQRILRVTPECRRNESQILAELEFMDYLRQKGIPAVQFILSKNNKKIETISTDMGIFYGVVFERAPGDFVEIIENRDKEKFFLWGKMVAQMHQASLSFDPSVNVKRWSWRDEFTRAYKILGKEDWPLREILQEKEKWMESLLQEDMYGLIHYDLTSDNIIWNDDGSFIIIDFDDAAYYPFVADIAFAVDGLVKEDPIIASEMLSWFIEGYTQVKSLPGDWKEQLENFFIIEKILKYVINKMAYIDSNPVLDTHWLKEMRERHSNWQTEVKKLLTLSWKRL